MRKHRRRILTLVATSYVAAAAFAGGGPPGFLGFCALLLALGLAWRAGGSLPPLSAGACLSAAIALASVAAGGGAPRAVAALGDAAVGASLVIAHLAIAKLAAAPSLADALSRPRPWTAGIPALFGGGAVVLLVTSQSRGAAIVMLLAAAISVAAFALVELRRRRLELGIRARTLAAFATLAFGLGGVAAASALLPSGFGDVALRGALAPAALAAALIARHAGELALARTARVLSVHAVLGGGLLLFLLDVAFDRPQSAGAYVIVGGVIALAIGTFAPRLADALRPEKGAWLEAIGEAEGELLRSGVDEAVRGALVRLRAPAGPNATSPELWTFDPIRVVRVDAAGYAREIDGVYPADVVSAALSEPEATLRAEVLERLQVRRPDLRSALRWLDNRGAFAATVISEGGEPCGLLVLAMGGRADVMTLEEVVMLKRLADRFAGIAAFRSAVARGLERERMLAARIEGLEDRALALEHIQARDAARHERATMRLARPATVGLYAPSSRLAYELLESRTRVGAPLVVIHPSGIEPTSYIARAHLSGARSKGPLVLVDGTAAREHEKQRWVDPVASPLALADRGLLVLVDGAALPADVQRLVAQALAEKRAPWERAEPLDIGLALTSVAEPDQLVASGRLEPALVARLGDALASPVRLPPLADRPEDLRSLLTDRLAREGLRSRGEPVALSDGALGELVEYAFPGDETELQALVVRLVAVASGPVIRAEDVRSLGLEPADEEGQTAAEADRHVAPGGRAPNVGTPKIRLV